LNRVFCFFFTNPAPENAADFQAYLYGKLES